MNNTEPDDKIYALGGIESVVYFLTKRDSPSRFIFSWIIFSDSHGKGKLAEGYREELLNDLMTETPKYIVTVRAMDTFVKFTDLYAFLATNYVLDKTFPDDRFVYVLKNIES